MTGDLAHIYPDFVMMAAAFGVPARRVVAPGELRGAIREALDTPGPFLLDVMVPHVEHVLPMIPVRLQLVQYIFIGHVLKQTVQSFHCCLCARRAPQSRTVHLICPLSSALVLHFKVML